MIKQRNNKKGQVTIWVIIAIILVAGIISLFYFLRPNLNANFGTASSFNPNAFLDDCLSDEIQQIADVMIKNGGPITPTNFIAYESLNVSYLCQNTGNFRPCVNQNPALIKNMQNEMHEFLKPKIDECFSQMEQELKSRGFQSKFGPHSSELSFVPDGILLDINKEMTFTKDEQSQSFDKYRIQVAHPVYDLAIIANEIASQEAKYCYFEYVGYMVLHPEFRIKLISMPDSNVIYQITEKRSSKTFNIGIRSCALPAGI